MELLFGNFFCLFALGFLYCISTTISELPPVPKWRDWFNLHTYDPVEISLADFYLNCTGCPYVYFPICGDDNQTYINECKLACKNAGRKVPVNMTRTGPCNIFATND